MENMLTIDWDYFVPEKSYYDFGHNESSFCINDIWSIRATSFQTDLVKEIKTTNELKGFWDYLRTKFDIQSNIKLIITESHLDAYNLVEENNIKQIYCYDSHCDLGYNGLKELSKSKYIDCGNWLGLSLLNQCLEKANLIYSPHTLEYNDEQFRDITCLINDNYKNNRFNYLEKDFEIDNKIPISLVHICRSGGWTPPWLDNELETFINSSGIDNIISNIKMRGWIGVDKQREQYSKFLSTIDCNE